jgi:hypothetical protein
MGLDRSMYENLSFKKYDQFWKAEVKTKASENPELFVHKKNTETNIA